MNGGDDGRVRKRLVAAGLVIMFLVGLFVGRFFWLERRDDAGPGDQSFCEVVSEFSRIDASYMDALSGSFPRHDALSVEWRHLVGEIRLAAWFDEREIWDVLAKESAVLELAPLGLLSSEDEWGDPLVRDAYEFASVLEATCGVSFDGGFLTGRAVSQP
ncbi:MAG: hypothetical protein GY750_17885 [Lentisphaerae bacterium]|nr:hypothetical protein [Lentisphaerota bacterium]